MGRILAITGLERTANAGCAAALAAGKLTKTTKTA
jgi:hypothetical protein